MKILFKIYLFIYLLLPLFVLASNSSQIVTGIYVYSSTTATTTATTTAPSSEGGGMPSLIGLNRLRIVDFSIITATTSVNFNVELSNPSKLFTYIGEGPELEKGLVFSGALSKKNSFELNGLEPNKQYYYRIDFIDTAGSEVSTGIKTFFTSTVFTDMFEQKNVSGLEIKVQNNGFELSWDKTNIEERSYFRVIKSYKFYPTDPNDGIPLYEGKEVSFIDTSVIENTRYFYTVFTCNNRGLCSSGVGVSSFFGKEKIEVPIPVPIAPEKDQGIKSIIILENEKEIISRDGIYYVSGDNPIRILVRMESLSTKDIKEVLTDVYLENKTVGSHFAKYNEEKGYFETSGFYLIDGGKYDIKINVFGLDKKIISGKELKFDSYQKELPISENKCLLDFAGFISCYWWILFLFIISTIVLWFIA